MVTPSHLVTALKSYGGLENCTVELISLKRDRLLVLHQACVLLDKKVKKVVKRTNDVFFSYSKTFLTKSNSPNGAEKFKNIPSYSLIAYEYSGKVKLAICYWPKYLN